MCITSFLSILPQINFEKKITDIGQFSSPQAKVDMLIRIRISFYFRLSQENKFELIKFHVL